jgi:shikimate kinase
MKDQDLRSNKIFLVGMPGSGKSTIGRLLAEKLAVAFIDLDTAIVEKEQESIAEIFEKKGEDYFRKVESEVLQSLLQTNEDFIMSTGGGTPCFFDHMNILNRAGTTIYLKASVNLLTERTKKNTKRPLLKDNHESRIRQLLQDREPVYQMSNHIIEIKGLTLEEKVSTIADLL